MVFLMNDKIEGVVVTPLLQIKSENGDIYHGLKANESSFKGFGEAYFSHIEPGAIKGWKKHRKATLNIIVPAGTIEFVIFDDRENSKSKGRFQSVILSSSDPETYCRLTIPPGLWMAFRGLDKQTSLLLDIIDMVHSDEEGDRKTLDKIDYPW
jgi:dTDP-4-dehydrorhamnose 3,5-epimerase